MFSYDKRNSIDQHLCCLLSSQWFRCGFLYRNEPRNQWISGDEFRNVAAYCKFCNPYRRISHQSGAAEVLKYALKVDFWDVDAMADDIYALLQYPALSDFATKQGYDEVNALKWNNATAKLKKVYESVVK